MRSDTGQPSNSSDTGDSDHRSVVRIQVDADTVVLECPPHASVVRLDTAAEPSGADVGNNGAAPLHPDDSAPWPGAAVPEECSCSDSRCDDVPRPNGGALSGDSDQSTLHVGDRSSPNATHADRSHLNQPGRTDSDRWLIRVFGEPCVDGLRLPPSALRAVCLVATKQHVSAETVVDTLSGVRKRRLAIKTLQNIKELRGLVNSSADLWTLQPGVESELSLMRRYADILSGSAVGELSDSMEASVDLLLNLRGAPFGGDASSRAWEWAFEYLDYGLTPADHAMIEAQNLARVLGHRWIEAVDAGYTDLPSATVVASSIVQASNRVTRNGEADPRPFLHVAASVAHRGTAADRTRVQSGFAISARRGFEPDGEALALIASC